jgi:hypothetical protein
MLRENPQIAQIFADAKEAAGQEMPVQAFVLSA